MALVDENYRDDCQLRDQDTVDVERYLSMRDRAPATGRAIHLRGLDDRAAGQTVERCFKAFGVRDGGAWREAILARAANWPQHLAVYLNAAIRQLREASPERMDAAGADLEAAMREGDRARAKYYEQRLARLRRRHGGFLAPAGDEHAYSMPIPSFARYLLGDDRARTPH